MFGSNYETAIKNLKESNKNLTSVLLKKLNEILLTTERYLTNKDGLPNTTMVYS